MKARVFHIVIAIRARWAAAHGFGARTRRPFTGITALDYELLYCEVIRIHAIFGRIVIVTFIIVLVVRAGDTLAIGNKVIAQYAVYTGFASYLDRIIRLNRLCAVILGDYKRANAGT